ncbi:MAG: hypothetical protein Rsou_2050 [Candidatus Ruthia sp. Asou_11_S2]|nr:hypothetical protein [Candidatus Ruthia sp. Asou_11_S2]
MIDKLVGTHPFVRAIANTPACIFGGILRIILLLVGGFGLIPWSLPVLEQQLLYLDK